MNKRTPRGWERQNIGYQSKSGPTCPRCGRQPVRDCPARDAICRKCHKRGHFQYVCRSSTNVSSITTNTSEESDAFLGTIEAEDNPWEVTLQVNDQPVTFNIDTGAEVTVISQKKHRNIGCPKLTNSDRRLKGPDSHILTILWDTSQQLWPQKRASLNKKCMSSQDLICHC